MHPLYKIIFVLFLVCVGLSIHYREEILDFCDRIMKRDQ